MKKLKTGLIIALLMLISCNLFAANKLHERHYQAFANRKMFDSKGILEYRYKDEDGNFSRVDILLPDEAIEVDFARKRDESVGQAARYALATGRPPAILLIVKNERDKQYLREARRTASKTFVEYLPGRVSNIKVHVYNAFPCKAERP